MTSLYHIWSENVKKYFNFSTGHDYLAFYLRLIELTRFESSEIFVYSVYVANVLRDFITMTIEIVLNIMLVYFFSRFVNARAQLTGSPNEGLNSADKANTITTFILSVLSICLHICTFTVMSKLLFKIIKNVLIFLIDL